MSLGKLSWACFFCAPYAMVTEGLGAWGAIFGARGAALAFAALSVLLTCIFQTANVGMNSRLRSPAAAVVTQLQPVVQLCLAVVLAGTPVAAKLGLSVRPTPGTSVALVLLLVGALCYFLASARRRQELSHLGGSGSSGAACGGRVARSSRAASRV
eukprot:TRINITY_DN22002_c0_g1_i3.p1 TRINITY_DN22002_c0_g1~~TRINITY_DN22002_c0_g1_i3.p1  ORF type:complete len:156 (+),score=30.42 TRINITY_DN22002_c0_g1_i3:648-1115(+)